MIILCYIQYTIKSCIIIVCGLSLIIFLFIWQQISIGLSHAFSQSLNRTQESAKVVEEIEGVDGQDTPSKPRRLQIDPETSIRYMESQGRWH